MKQHGLRSPALSFDIATLILLLRVAWLLVGFDNIEAATMVRPALTTINPFQLQIGRRAAELLIERIRSEEPIGNTWEETPFELVVRQSA